MRIGQKGFTLVEIIVSLAIMTIVAGSVGAFIVAGNNSYLRGSKELTAGRGTADCKSDDRPDH